MTHPCAKFSDELLPEALDLIDDATSFEDFPEHPTLLDPFAGTGKGVDYMRAHGYRAIGVELEPEWATLSPNVIVGNALCLPFEPGTFDVVFTSPTYGNRMADKDKRPSVAGTYMKSLGREASEGSSCHLQWGDKYRHFHEQAWREVHRVLKPGGIFVLNVKDHPRNKQVQRVTDWHVAVCEGIGFEVQTARKVKCPGNKRGTNKDSAIEHEWLVLMRKVEK